MEELAGQHHGEGEEGQNQDESSRETPTVGLGRERERGVRFSSFESSVFSKMSS